METYKAEIVEDETLYITPDGKIWKYSNGWAYEGELTPQCSDNEYTE